MKIKNCLFFLIFLSFTFCLSAQIAESHKYVGIIDDDMFSQPTDVTVDNNGYIYIADIQQGKVYKFDPSDLDEPMDDLDVPGTYWNGSDVFQHTDIHIAVGTDNSLFISLFVPGQGGVVFKYSLDFTFQYGVYSDDNYEFTPRGGIAVGPDNTVYIANNGVYFTDNILTIPGSFSDPLTQGTKIITDDDYNSDYSVHNCSDVLVDGSGNIYVSMGIEPADNWEKVVKVFNSSIVYQYKIVGEEDAILATSSIAGQYVEPDDGTIDLIYFDELDGEGAPEIIRGDEGEASLGTEALPETLGETSGLGIDAMGRLYVVAHDDGGVWGSISEAVYIFDTNNQGEYIAQIGPGVPFSTEVDNIEDAEDIWVTPTGKIFLTETGNVDRILMFAIVPEVVSATTSADGMSVSVTFSVEMEAPSTGDGGYEFTIIAGGNELPIASISQPSSKVYTFTLSAPVQPGQTVTINYGEEAAPTALSVNSIAVNPVTSTDGATLDPFSSAFNVTNSVVSPQAVSVKTNAMGTKLYVTFNQDLQDPVVDVLPSLTFSGMTNSVTAIVKKEGSNDILELTLQNYISYGQSGINLQYPGGMVTGYLRNIPGVNVETFNLPITNKIPAPPTLVSATIREGSQILILTFNQDMTDVGSNYSDFTVDITGNSPNNPKGGYFPKGATDHNVIALTLDHPIGEDATGGTVNYTEVSGYFAANGARLATFSEPFQIQIMPKVPLANWGIGLLVFLIIGTILFIKRR